MSGVIAIDEGVDGVDGVFGVDIPLNLANPFERGVAIFYYYAMEKKKKLRINIPESRVFGRVPVDEEAGSAPRNSRLSTVILKKSIIGSESGGASGESRRRTSVINPWTATKRLL